MPLRRESDRRVVAEHQTLKFHASNCACTYKQTSHLKMTTCNDTRRLDDPLSSAGLLGNSVGRSAYSLFQLQPARTRVLAASNLGHKGYLDLPPAHHWEVCV